MLSKIAQRLKSKTYWLACSGIIAAVTAKFNPEFALFIQEQSVNLFILYGGLVAGAREVTNKAVSAK